MEKLDTEEILKYFKLLTSNKEALDWLKKNKNIEFSQVTDCVLGFDPGAQRFLIPIKNREGRIVDAEWLDMNDKSDWLALAESAYEEVPLSISLNSEHYNKKIKFSGIIIGKDLSPFTIPHVIKACCLETGSTDKDKKKCFFCPLEKGDDIEFSLKIDEHKRLLVSMLGASDLQVMTNIRRHFAIPPINTCRQVEMDLDNAERINVEEVRLTSEVDYERVDSDYVVHRCFVFGAQIQTNQQYMCWGTAYNDPQSQHAIHLIKRVQSKRDSISKWELPPEMFERLKIFQPENPDDFNSVQSKLAEIHRDISTNVTKMKKREDVVQAFDMVYNSVLSFKFLGQTVHKGWAECAIIGDTRTGKTETIKSLVHHYRCGEFITSGENTTLAGLLGGVQQTHQGSWALTWGKLVMNDRRAVVIDEADSLIDNDVIGHLSGVRSSGVAELVKIQTQRTMARTRLIFIANPRKGMVNEYNFGVETIPEIFGKQQDISRLDFAIMCNKYDVPDKEINAPIIEKVPHAFVSELCHARTMFAWTRAPEQIIWEDGVEDLILKMSIAFGEKYSPEIPLVIGAEFRMKLAKLTLSTAIQVFSVDDELRLIVKKAHVHYSAWWLQKIYDETTMGYLDFSEQKKQDRTIKYPDDLELLMNDDLNRVNELLNCQRIQMNDAEDIFNADRQDARKNLATMRKCMAIRKVSYYYVKTPQFINWLKEERINLNRHNPLEDDSDTPFGI